MSEATTTNPGQIILSGDLTGEASAPQLRPTGVIPGTYTYPNIVVDSKGRVIFAKSYTSGGPPVATASQKGVVSSDGKTFTIASGVLSATLASNTDLGVVTIGTTESSTTFPLTLTADTVSMPAATSSSSGAVKVGSGLTIDYSGTLTPNVASKSYLGVVIPDSTFSTTLGVISAPVTTTSSMGVFYSSSSLTIDAYGVAYVKTADAAGTFGLCKARAQTDTISSGIYITSDSTITADVSDSSTFGIFKFADSNAVNFLTAGAVFASSSLPGKFCFGEVGSTSKNVTSTTVNGYPVFNVGFATSTLAGLVSFPTTIATFSLSTANLLYASATQLGIAKCGAGIKTDANGAAYFSYPSDYLISKSKYSTVVNNRVFLFSSPQYFAGHISSNTSFTGSDLDVSGIQTAVVSLVGKEYTDSTGTYTSLAYSPSSQFFTVGESNTASGTQTEQKMHVTWDKQTSFNGSSILGTEFTIHFKTTGVFSYDDGTTQYAVQHNLLLNTKSFIAGKNLYGSTSNVSGKTMQYGCIAGSDVSTSISGLQATWISIKVPNPTTSYSTCHITLKVVPLYFSSLGGNRLLITSARAIYS